MNPFLLYFAIIWITGWITGYHILRNIYSPNKTIDRVAMLGITCFLWAPALIGYFCWIIIQAIFIDNEKSK
jgi:hypothetical protein